MSENNSQNNPHDPQISPHRFVTGTAATFAILLAIWGAVSSTDSSVVLILTVAIVIGFKLFAKESDLRQRLTELRRRRELVGSAILVVLVFAGLKGARYLVRQGRPTDPAGGHEQQGIVSETNPDPHSGGRATINPSVINRLYISTYGDVPYKAETSITAISTSGARSMGTLSLPHYGPLGFVYIASSGLPPNARWADSVTRNGRVIFTNYGNTDGAGNMQDQAVAWIGLETGDLITIVSGTVLASRIY
jgi:hypothetical protein